MWLSVVVVVVVVAAVAVAVAVVVAAAAAEDFGWGSTTDPAGGAYSAPQTP